jgi:tRNA pseudouridine38-40 synthase
MTRWRCTCAYDGTSFSGWQSQAAGDAIQDEIERRLAAIFGAAVRIHGSGRTDAGVHASGQVFHFDADWRHGTEKLAAALRFRLARAIQIRAVRPARPDFHARFSATGKVYSYHLFRGDPDPFVRPYRWAVPRTLELAAVRAGAARLRGRHDFRSFSALRGEPGEDQADTVRDLRRLEVSGRGREVRITAEADGFLYKMVRSLVGALVAVGEGKLTLPELVEILEARHRTARVLTAPPQGLFLRRVLY